MQIVRPCSDLQTQNLHLIRFPIPKVAKQYNSMPSHIILGSALSGVLGVGKEHGNTTGREGGNAKL